MLPVSFVLCLLVLLFPTSQASFVKFDPVSALSRTSLLPKSWIPADVTAIQAALACCSYHLCSWDVFGQSINVQKLAINPPSSSSSPAFSCEDITISWKITKAATLLDLHFASPQCFIEHLKGSSHSNFELLSRAGFPPSLATSKPSTATTSASPILISSISITSPASLTIKSSYLSNNQPPPLTISPSQLVALTASVNLAAASSAAGGISTAELYKILKHQLAGTLSTRLNTGVKSLFSDMVRESQSGQAPQDILDGLKQRGLASLASKKKELADRALKLAGETLEDKLKSKRAFLSDLQSMREQFLADPPQPRDLNSSLDALRSTWHVIQPIANAPALDDEIEALLHMLAADH